MTDRRIARAEQTKSVHVTRQPIDGKCLGTSHRRGVPSLNRHPACKGGYGVSRHRDVRRGREALCVSCVVIICDPRLRARDLPCAVRAGKERQMLGPRRDFNKRWVRRLRL